MIDLNLNEFLLLWGVYGMSIVLSILLGYYVAKRKNEKDE